MTLNLDFCCSICGRSVPKEYQEEHHFVPSSICKRNKYLKIETNHKTIKVCRCCGDMLHKLFSLKELAEQYNTIEKIKDNEDVQNWIRWISKKPNDFNICMKEKKKKF